MHGSPSSPGVMVLYFAALRDLAKASEEQVALASTPLSIAGFLELLQAHRPELAGRLQSVRVAVNEEFAEPTTLLCGGEVVALIPPVSGG